MQIIKVRFLISLAAETAALPGKPGVLGGKFPGSLCDISSFIEIRNLRGKIYCELDR
jgi:hypothetical protein